MVTTKDSFLKRRKPKMMKWNSNPALLSQKLMKKNNCNKRKKNLPYFYQHLNPKQNILLPNSKNKLKKIIKKRKSKRKNMFWKKTLSTLIRKEIMIIIFLKRKKLTKKTKDEKDKFLITPFYLVLEVILS